MQSSNPENNGTPPSPEGEPSVTQYGTHDQEFSGSGAYDVRAEPDEPEDTAKSEKTPLDLKPALILDADHTFFKDHLFNNKMLATYVDILADRIAENPNDLALQQQLRETFVKGSGPLAEMLMNAQNAGIDIVIASYSRTELAIAADNLKLSREYYCNNLVAKIGENPKLEQFEKDNAINIAQRNLKNEIAIIDRQIADHDPAIKPTPEENKKERQLNGPYFLQKIFQAAYPDIKLTMPPLAFYPINPTTQKVDPNSDLYGKTQQIKEYIANRYPGRDVDETYKQLLKFNLMTLIDDSEGNRKVFDKDMRDVTGTIPTNAGAIVVNYNNRDETNHIETADKWVTLQRDRELLRFLQEILPDFSITRVGTNIEIQTKSTTIVADTTSNLILPAEANIVAQVFRENFDISVKKAIGSEKIVIEEAMLLPGFYDMHSPAITEPDSAYVESISSAATIFSRLGTSPTAENVAAAELKDPVVKNPIIDIMNQPQRKNSAIPPLARPSETPVKPLEDTADVSKTKRLSK